MCATAPSTAERFDTRHLRHAIAAAGIVNTFFGSGFRQKNSPTLVKGLRQRIAMPVDMGHDEHAVRPFMPENVETLLDIH